MSRVSIGAFVEATPKKVFVSALDWPGLSRGGKTEDAAVEALLASVPRYAKVAAEAGLSFSADDVAIEVVERAVGNASTEFGVPAIIAEADRAPVDAVGAVRLAALIAASWVEFDRIAAKAPVALRKGPRGGGRDRSKVVQHVIDADAAYAAVMGRKHRPVDPAAITGMREDILDVLRQPSDGSPIAGRKWPPRYAARRVAWHVLDHAWEIEDRSDPA